MKIMKNMMITTVMLVATPMALSAPVSAQDFPLIAGDYSEVGGIYVKDGGTYKYAKFIAEDWVKNQEFAKSQGWITDYKIYINVNRRDGEPNVYLMSSFPNLPNAAEDERRNKAYRDFAKKSSKQLSSESGNRAEYRTIKSSLLLREYKVR